MKKYDLSWGNPYCIKQALDFHYSGLIWGKGAIDKLDYCLDDGYPELIGATRKFLIDTVGINYKHILITNGATGALNVIMRVMAENYSNIVIPKYSFPFYPHMAAKNGLSFTDKEMKSLQSRSFRLIASPSNPFGEIHSEKISDLKVIFDSVYHSKVFINTNKMLHPIYPEHIVNCGSYSKFLGIAGARIGFVATNNANIYELAKMENLHESCTISMPGQLLVFDILKKVDLEIFATHAQYKVNCNREEFSRLKSLFGGQIVQENGMFYCANADHKLIELLDRVEIGYKLLDITNDGGRLLRFSLGQTNELTKEAVDTIIKEDKI